MQRGGLTLDPNLTLDLSPNSSISDGTYHLIDYSIGSLTDNSNGFSGWTLANAPAGTSYTFSNDTSPGDNGLASIDVTFSQTTIPEPACGAIFVLSALAVRGRRNRRVPQS